MAFFERIKNAKKRESPSPEQKQPARPISNMYAPGQADYRERLRHNPEPSRRLFTVDQAPSQYIQPAHVYKQRPTAPTVVPPNRNLRSSLKSSETIKAPDLTQYSRRPASQNQFKKYLRNSENVFFEDSLDFKKILFSKFVARLIASLLVLAIMFLFSVYTMERFDGKVPDHGYIRNGVLYCDTGYLKDGDSCLLDTKLLQRAENFAISQINNLRYQWGDGRCAGDQFTKPYYKLSTLLVNDLESVDSAKLMIMYDQVKNFLSKRDNQQHYKFSFDGQIVEPTERSTSLKCYLQLFCSSWLLYPSLTVLLGLVVLAYKVAHHNTRRRVARKMYLYLKDRLRQDSNILIEKEQSELQKFGKMDKELWELVDQYRVEEGEIGYYEDDNLYWRRL